MKDLEEERDQLAERLWRWKTRFEGGGGSEDRRRYELAMEDVREMKSRVQELERELAQARAAKPSALAVSAAGGLDWEAEKRRIMAALEAEDDDDPEAAKERLRIEDVIRTTEQALAERDQEIESLQRILEDQSKNWATWRWGGRAGAVLDRTRSFKRNARTSAGSKGVEEKLRQAEIEISIERQNRSRTVSSRRSPQELEARLEHVEADPHGVEKTGSPDKPARGRWLARLGLKDLEEE